MNPHALYSPIARLLWCVMLCPFLTHCASTPKEVALHTITPMQASTRVDEGVGFGASVRGASRERAFSLTPTAGFSVSTRALVEIALGVDLRLLLDPDRTGAPLPMIMSAGFDALNMGCQGIPQCHLGAAGVHGEVGIVVLQHERAGSWSVSVGVDQDVRFGPSSTTSWLAGVRWTPTR